MLGTLIFEIVFRMETQNITWNIGESRQVNLLTYSGTFISPMQIQYYMHVQYLQCNNREIYLQRVPYKF